MRNFSKYAQFKVGLICGSLLVSACSTLEESKTTTSHKTSKSNTTDLQCLAQAIQGEARGEVEEGKLLVGRVIATRVQYGYGKNYCDVVNAKRQFAPKKHFTETSLMAAKKSHQLGPNGITHFHSYPRRKTKKASFSMSPKCKYKGKIGGHWTFLCHERGYVLSDNEP